MLKNFDTSILYCSLLTLEETFKFLQMVYKPIKVILYSKNLPHKTTNFFRLPITERIKMQKYSFVTIFTNFQQIYNRVINQFHRIDFVSLN